MEKLKLKHAKLLNEKRKYHEMLFGQKVFVEERFHNEAKQENPELYEAYTEAKAAVHRFENRLLATPKLFDKLQYWMVDVVGKANCEDNGQKIVERFFENGDMYQAVEDSDNLFGLIRKYITEHGFKITDCGGGCGEWHLGVPCTEAESRRLIEIMHKDFDSFFDEGVLFMKRMFWGVNWTDLRNMHDAEQILKR